MPTLEEIAKIAGDSRSTVSRVINNAPNVADDTRQRVLQIATDLAREGREGRAVGTTFVLGDCEQVQSLAQQLVINPFRGYRDEAAPINRLRTDRAPLEEFAELRGF